MGKCTYAAKPWLLAISQPVQPEDFLSTSARETGPLPEGTLPPGSLSKAALSLHPGTPHPPVAAASPSAPARLQALLPGSYTCLEGGSPGLVPTPVPVRKPGSDYRPSETQIP